jgi:hypothetical protein
MKQLGIAGAAVAAVALALPAAAAAQGSVFQVAVPGPPVTPEGETQYVVSNHGFSYVLRESNEREANHGMLNYKLAPPAYRAGIPASQLIAETDTGAQPHATCAGVAALEDEAAILAWQDAEPSYNYVPFQKTSAGLGDDPSRWLDLVQEKTGVDLRTVPDAQAACEALSGATATYVPADQTETSAAAFAAGTIAAERAPLEAQVASLTAANDAAEAQVAALTAQKTAADAQVARLTAANATADAQRAAADRARAAALAQLSAANTALAGSRSDAERYLLASAPVALAVFGTTKASTVARRGVSISVTGPALRPATVHLRVGRRRARALGLRSRVLARKVTTIGAGGSTIVVIKPGPKVAKALRRLDGSVKVSVTAVSSSRDSATTTFVG